MTSTPSAILREGSRVTATTTALNYEATPLWRKLPTIPIALTFGFLAFLLLPRVQANPTLVWTFASIGGVLLAWEGLLWARNSRQRVVFPVEFVAIKSHWVQGCVQFGIMLYWGWYAEAVYPEMPLIAAQLVYLYVLEALFTWSRGKTWRMGFGPLPIILSTNLLLWFKDDWFYLQFVMITIGIMGKQFITWEREGKRTHIFNPSAFGQSVVAFALIATATTNELTWGRQIASTFEVPHMLVVIFLGGLIVQYLFGVTLMTVSAAAVLLLTNLIYTWSTGLYYFVDVTIAAPIFLGIHLLITDPATSPKSNVGRVIFGAAYAMGYVILFRVFDMIGVPLFWDKLLPVPFLNLCVPLIDRLARSGFVGNLNARWQEALPFRTLNLVHMGCWIALFCSMAATGLIEAAHPGDSIPFWKQAYKDGKPYAGPSLVMAAGSLAEGGRIGAAYNEIGLICIEEKIVPGSASNAAGYFVKASELGDVHGSMNVGIHYLFMRGQYADADVARAFDQLERQCGQTTDWRVCYLVAVAYETGRGRPKDTGRAAALYQSFGPDNLYAWKGLARLSLAGELPNINAARIAKVLEAGCATHDAECCWYAAYLNLKVNPGDETRARSFLQHACQLGSKQACDALQQPKLPAYENPVMLVPGWVTAYPLQ